MRFDRQTSVPGVDQAKIGQASALVVGAGGLGSPVIAYLAGAGFGRVDVCDDDVVDLTNVHRQILYVDSDSGRRKAYAASDRIKAVGVRSDAFTVRFGTEVKVVPRFDRADRHRYTVVVDCTDRWSSHDAVISAGLADGVPVVHGSIQWPLGRVIVFRPGGACWRCLHPVSPTGVRDGTRGTLGPLCGVIGSMMALEALRVALGWEGLRDSVVVYEALAARISHFDLPRDPTCRCGGPG